MILRRILFLTRWLLGNRPLGVVAHVDAEVPVTLGEPLTIPIEQRLVITFDDVVDVEADIPINTHIDLDTTIETEVLRIGRVRLPIKARVPISLTLPIKARVNAKVAQLPIEIKDTVSVSLKSVSVPVSARLRTGVSLDLPNQ